MNITIFDKVRNKWRRFKARLRETYYSESEARKIAEKYNLLPEFEEALDFGLTPDEALEEWDIYPYGEDKKKILEKGR